MGWKKRRFSGIFDSQEKDQTYTAIKKTFLWGEILFSSGNCLQLSELHARSFDKWTERSLGIRQ